MSANSSNFTSFFYKATCHANLGSERNFAGSNWEIFEHISLTFSKTSAKNNVSLLSINHDVHLNFLFRNL